MKAFGGTDFLVACGADFSLPSPHSCGDVLSAANQASPGVGVPAGPGSLRGCATAFDLTAYP
jgi:hypothetical protein